MSFGRFEFITNLQYKIKHLQHEVDAFKSNDKYVKMNLDFQKILTERDRRIKKLQNELADSRRRIVTVRNNWMHVFDDLEAEHAEVIRNNERCNKALEERALNAERQVDELKDGILALKRECYDVKIKLEEERAKNQKLTAQINRDYENSSISAPLKTSMIRNRRRSITRTDSI